MQRYTLRPPSENKSEDLAACRVNSRTTLIGILYPVIHYELLSRVCVCVSSLDTKDHFS